MSEWKPIDTAPKDGTEILVWWPLMKLDDDGNLTDEPTANEKGCRVVTWWDGGSWAEPPYFEARGGWFGDDNEYSQEPKLWADIPSPPTA